MDCAIGRHRKSRGSAVVRVSLTIPWFGHVIRVPIQGAGSRVDSGADLQPGEAAPRLHEHGGPAQPQLAAQQGTQGLARGVRRRLARERTDRNMPLFLACSGRDSAPIR